MHHRRQNDAEPHVNSESCTVWEYGGIGAIDGADARIDGRYPEVGYALNEVSDMSVRILSGTGRLATQHTAADLIAGDVAFVPHGEAYFFEGQSLSFFMACTPAWSAEQYREIDL